MLMGYKQEHQDILRSMLSDNVSFLAELGGPSKR